VLKRVCSIVLGSFAVMGALPNELTDLEARLMKPNWEVLAELGVLLDREPEKGEAVTAAAFDRLGFPYPAEHYDADLVRQLVLDLERRRGAGMVVRGYQEDGLGRLYYEADAADGGEDTQLRPRRAWCRRSPAAPAPASSDPGPDEASDSAVETPSRLVMAKAPG
jgi:hypothetical protein